jgi:hypothetical protein
MEYPAWPTSHLWQKQLASIQMRSVKAQYQTTSNLWSTIDYMLDGGSLLHRLQWNKGDSFEKIASMYADFVCHRFGTSNCTVVFDGYLAGLSIKDTTHHRRASKKSSSSSIISFTPASIFAGQKEVLLVINQNKQSLYPLLSRY